jgi:hypothetical protein
MSEKLYIDALNFGNFFFAKTKYTWSLKDPYDRVKLFVDACKKANLDIIIFIDESVETDEAINKWKSRREKEVYNQEKYMPQGMSYFLGDMFKSLGVTVYYSLDEDNDDTIAFYANADGANILSGDGDFYRYIDRKYKIYSDFNHSKLLSTGKLELLTNSKARENSVIESRKDMLREIRAPPNCIDVKCNIPFVPILEKFKIYRRGVPSPLIRKLGYNPHIKIKPIRRAIYNHIFKDKDTVIFEEFPSWSESDNCTVWLSENVTLFNPNDNELKKITKMLKGDPNIIFKEYFPKEADSLERLNNKKKVIFPDDIDFKQWKKHCFACKSITFELCCIINGKSLFSYFI